jgi:hemerythrin superfamily protein
MSEGNISNQQHFALQFQQELTKHSTAEEMILYPAFEQYLGDEGKKIADEDRNEHQTVCLILFLS